MSGFALIYSKKNRNPEDLESLLSSMTRRVSPYIKSKQEKYYDNRVAIEYFSYLSWEDLNANFINSEEYLICLDGYILSYNSEIIEQDDNLKLGTDASKLLFLYRRFGVDFVSNINGIYNLILYDKLKNSLILSTDRYGYRNLYYADKYDYLLFSTEFKSISESGLISKSPDYQAIYDLHLYHFIVGEKTLLKEISLFPYGHMLIANSNDVRWKKYWEYPRHDELFKKDINKLTEESFYHIENSLKRIVEKKPGELSVSLSGGLDSRMIAGMLSRINNKAPSFHFGTKHMNETKIAKSISDVLKSDFYLFNCKTSCNYRRTMQEGCELTDCQYSPDQFIMYDFAKFMSEIFPNNIILHGLGMDVLFRIHTSSIYEKKNKKSSYDHKDKREMLESGFRIVGKYLIKEVFRRDVSEEMLKMTSLSEEIERFPSKDLQNLYQFFYFNNRGRRYVLGSPYSHKLFCKYFFPGMEYDLFDFAVKLPKELRWQTVLYREVFVRYFKELSKIPYSWTGVPLDQWKEPHGSLKDKLTYYINCISMGNLNFGIPPFSPDKQYRKDKVFREFVQTIIKDRRSLERGFFTSGSLDRLLKQIRVGKNYFGLIATILGVELFFRRHID